MDFLSSLLDRSFERTPVLERRRPAIFEPQSSGFDTSARDFEPERAPAERAPIDPPPGGPVITRTETLRHETERVIERETGTAPPALKPPISRRPELDERRDVSIQSKAGNHASTDAKPAIRRTPRTIVDPPAVRQVTSIVEYKAAPVTRESKEAPAPLAKPASTPKLAANNAPIFKQAVLPVARQVTAAAAQPTIQVTIGRIEVRTSMPPSAPRSKRRAPSLNLSDYLQSRSAGGA